MLKILNINIYRGSSASFNSVLDNVCNFESCNKLCNKFRIIITLPKTIKVLILNIHMMLNTNCNWKNIRLSCPLILKLCSSYYPVKHVSIRLQNSQFLATHKETVTINPNLILHNVSFVPSFTFNLLTLSELLKNNNYHAIFVLVFASFRIIRAGGERLDWLTCHMVFAYYNLVVILHLAHFIIPFPNFPFPHILCKLCLCLYAN